MVGVGLGSTSIVCAEEVGWRNTCFLAGGVMFFSTLLLLLFVNEHPVHLLSLQNQPPATSSHLLSLFHNIQTLLSYRVIVLLFIAASLRLSSLKKNLFMILVFLNHHQTLCFQDLPRLPGHLHRAGLPW